MLLQYNFPVLLCTALSSAFAAPADTTSNADASHGGGYPWQYGGPDRSLPYWFEEFDSTLATMQDTYWNGTYWPTTIQWIGAFLNTILAASDRTYTNALEEYGNSVPRVLRSSSASIEADIKKYYSEIEAYYGGEDTIQIFGAAYDDAQWVVLEWLEAIKFINQYDVYSESSYGQEDIARFAHRAHIFYNIVQNQFDTSLCGGGITWNPALAPYKNAITNELFLASSISMYLYYPGDTNSDPYPSPDYINATNMTLPALPALAAHDPLLLSNAAREFDWFISHNFTNAQGLIVDGFHVSDNQTTCDERNEMVYTYNQGVILSGVRGLWEATGDSKYLTYGWDLVQTVIEATGWYAHSADQAGEWAGLGRNGIMEDYCDAPANCSQDNLAFKGTYFHHLDLFCEPLPTSTPLVAGLTHLASSDLAAQHAGKCKSYIPWVEHNAHAALATRNGSDIIGEWWGASYVNKTQAPWPAYAPHHPPGSTDEWNQPWVLQQPPWKCNGHHCHSGGRGHGGINGKRMAGLYAHRRAEAMRKRQSVDESDTRTVETQAGGVSVVKTVYDLLSRRPAT